MLVKFNNDATSILKNYKEFMVKNIIPGCLRLCFKSDNHIDTQFIGLKNVFNRYENIIKHQETLRSKNGTFYLVCYCYETNIKE